jgi:hypothetical protein
VNEERGEESQAGSLGAGSVRVERKKMEWTPRERVGDWESGSVSTASTGTTGQV